MSAAKAAHGRTLRQSSLIARIVGREGRPVKFPPIPEASGVPNRGCKPRPRRRRRLGTPVSRPARAVLRTAHSATSAPPREAGPRRRKAQTSAVTRAGSPGNARRPEGPERQFHPVGLPRKPHLASVLHIEERRVT